MLAFFSRKREMSQSSIAILRLLYVNDNIGPITVQSFFSRHDDLASLILKEIHYRFKISRAWFISQLYVRESVWIQMQSLILDHRSNVSVKAVFARKTEYEWIRYEVHAKWTAAAFACNHDQWYHRYRTNTTSWLRDRGLYACCASNFAILRSNIRKWLEDHQCELQICLQNNKYF